MSIRLYLVLIILSVITLVSFAAAVQGYKASMEEAEHVFDSELHSFALVLETIPLDHAVIDVSPESDVAFQIWNAGELSVRTSNSPEAPISRILTGYSEYNFSGQRWRVFGHSIPASDKWIMIAQPLKRRFELAENMILAAVSPLVIALPFLAILISIAIRRSLYPLRDLTAKLNRKSADDFSRIELGDPPPELTPVLFTLNGLLDRLDSAYLREKQFSSDVAHELGTPLSVLKISIHNLEQRQGDDGTDLAPLKQGVDRVSHVVKQMLLLHRTNPDNFNANFAEQDLYGVVQKVVADFYMEVESRQQTIELHGQSSHLLGDLFTLECLVGNLVSNASKYAPAGGSIRLSVTEEAGFVTLQCADSGPGVAGSDLSRVFDRFYRAGGDQHESAVSGCGLGLAIAKQIATLHSASLTASNGSLLGGLLVEVRFPSLSARSAV